MGSPVLFAEMRPHYERCTTTADSCGKLRCKDTYYNNKSVLVRGYFLSR